MEYKDYYKILGVERNADEKAIKQAYRRLARQYHPDVKPGDKEAEARFKEINEAYEVLGDADKRRKYDQLGSRWQQWQQGGFDPRNFDWSQWTQQAAGNPQGGRFYTNIDDLFGGGSGGRGGFSDFFEALFGGLTGNRAQQQSTSRRMSSASARRMLDVEHPIEITLEEAYKGTERILEVDGKRLQVKIPAGVRTGSRVRVSGEGANDPRESKKGDLYLHITVADHPNFERKDNHLYTEVPVDLYTALLGGEVHVPTPTGQVALKIPAGTQNGRTIRLAGLGMPSLDGGEKGHLYAKVRVALPDNLTDEEKRLFQQLARLRQRHD